MFTRNSFTRTGHTDNSEKPDDNTFKIKEFNRP